MWAIKSGQKNSRILQQPCHVSAKGSPIRAPAAFLGFFFCCVTPVARKQALIEVDYRRVDLWEGDEGRGLQSSEPSGFQSSELDIFAEPLVCRSACQSLHSLHALPYFGRKCFADFCFVMSFSPKLIPRCQTGGFWDCLLFG